MFKDIHQRRRAQLLACNTNVYHTYKFLRASTFTYGVQGYLHARCSSTGHARRSFNTIATSHVDIQSWEAKSGRLECSSDLVKVLR